MCDFVSGEVLFAFPDHPRAIEALSAWFNDHGAQENVRVLDRLDYRLNALDLPEEARLKSSQQLWRIQVPPGQEAFMSNLIRQKYHHALLVFGVLKDDQAPELLMNVGAEPNLLLTLADSPGSHSLYENRGLRLSPVHEDYKRIIGVDDSGREMADQARGPIVALVDSGITGDLIDRVDRQIDLVSPEQFGRPAEKAAEDQVLHGTAIASIIADVAPAARFMVYRVADEYGQVSEWDVIAALLSLGDADVVNLSLAFGLAGGDCRTCGRSANSSRSWVFERNLDLLTKKINAPIVVSAAGNASADRLYYPARFPDVVAIGSLNSRLEVSTFSNYGNTDHLNHPHRGVWFLPGGDDRPGQIEAAIVVGDDDKPLFGTSIACAYASAIITRLLGQHKRSEVISMLRAGAGASMVGYSPDIHGHGRMSLPSMRSQTPD